MPAADTIPSNLVIRNLTASADRVTRESALIAFAKARGIAELADVKQFVADAPEVTNTLADRPAYQSARDRLARAFTAQERIVFLGDYDCDGVSSLTLMLDLARAAGSKNHKVYIPERAVEDYGLTQKAADNCLEQHSPTLIFTVDCGSASLDVVRGLRAKGVEVIILDHHHVPALPAGGHPATAHLNPKDPAFGGDPELATLSAGGLSFLFAEAFATDQKLSSWDRRRGLAIAGLSTLVDVMPLTGKNRALVKNSLVLLNNNPPLVPGLLALRNALSVSKVTSYTYGFVFGPHLNAGGRLATAHDALRLLAAQQLENAQKFVPTLCAANNQRKEIQEKIVEEAFAAAEVLIGLKPDRRVLVLGAREWHPGVVGIVAGKIKEKYRRPVIVCGYNEATNVFKGSGRSIDSIHLGHLIEKAVKSGVIIGGGGHAMAIGLRLNEDQLPALQQFFDEETANTPLDMTERYEVLGEAGAMTFAEWMGVYDRLEPFGNSNPKPHLLISAAKLVGRPQPLTRSSDGHLFGYKGIFLYNGAKLALTWKNTERAAEEWRVGATYRMAVNISKNKTFENWNVDGCEAVAD